MVYILEEKKVFFVMVKKKFAPPPPKIYSAFNLRKYCTRCLGGGGSGWGVGRSSLSLGSGPEGVGGAPPPIPEYTPASLREGVNPRPGPVPPQKIAYPEKSKRLNDFVLDTFRIFLVIKSCPLSRKKSIFLRSPLEVLS